MLMKHDVRNPHARARERLNPKFTDQRYKTEPARWNFLDATDPDKFVKTRGNIWKNGGIKLE